MTADISYKTSWNNVIVLEDLISTNKYSCKLYFEINDEKGENQNNAFERVRILIEDLFDNSLVINIENPLLQTFVNSTKQRIITIPHEPLDVIMAAVIFNKINAIMEDHMILTKLRLSSDQGENVWVHFDEGFNEVFTSLENKNYKELDEVPWWERSDASTSDWFEVEDSGINYHKHIAEWSSDLGYKSSTTEESARPTSWKPEIIPGGKTKH